MMRDVSPFCRLKRYHLITRFVFWFRNIGLITLELAYTCMVRENLPHRRQRKSDFQGQLNINLKALTLNNN